MTEDSHLPRYIAEFVGTYLLVFTVGCNVIGGSPVWAATSIGCVLMVMIYSLGGVSGAHFNPAVSLSLALCHKVPWAQAFIYAVIQIIAGICGGFSYALLWNKNFNLAPKPGFGWWEVMMAETLYTFMLCFVVLNVAASEKNARNQYYGLAIGFVIVAGGYSVGNISGGAFNPAVAFGIDTSSANQGFGWAFAYVCYEVLGAVLAALYFRVVRPDEFGDERASYGLLCKLASEFIGTFFLVLTVGLNVLGKSPAPVWSIAASLMCMIYALGSVSGAHFNPAVTLAILASGRGKIRVSEALAYVGVQVLGGICGGLTYSSMHHGANFPLGPGKGFGWGHACVAEIIFTFVLCFVVLCVATVANNARDTFGLAIGSCVTAGGYAIGAISGGSLNPAVSAGVTSGSLAVHGFCPNCLVYGGVELVGGILAALVFRVVYPSEYPKSE